MRLLFLVPALLLAASTLLAHADSIPFDSHSGDSFEYGIDVTTSTPFEIGTGQTISFTGLADVTGASVQNPSLFTINFTSTSVTFTSQNSIAFSGGNFIGFFTIDSTASLGSITYTAETANEGILTGSIEGPAAPTPEPSTLALFGTGILGLAGVARRKLFNA